MFNSCTQIYFLSLQLLKKQNEHRRTSQCRSSGNEIPMCVYLISICNQFYNFFFCFLLWVFDDFLFLLDDWLVELKKQISCSLQVSNKTEEHVAFKVKLSIWSEFLKQMLDILLYRFPLLLTFRLRPRIRRNIVFDQTLGSFCLVPVAISLVMTFLNFAVHTSMDVNEFNRTQDIVNLFCQSLISCYCA